MAGYLLYVGLFAHRYTFINSVILSDSGLDILSISYYMIKTNPIFFHKILHVVQRHLWEANFEQDRHNKIFKREIYIPSFSLNEHRLFFSSQTGLFISLNLDFFQNEIVEDKPQKCVRCWGEAQIW